MEYTAGIVTIYWKCYVTFLICKWDSRLFGSQTTDRQICFWEKKKSLTQGPLTGNFSRAFICIIMWPSSSAGWSLLSCEKEMVSLLPHDTCRGFLSHDNRWSYSIWGVNPCLCCRLKRDLVLRIILWAFGQLFLN